MNHPLRILIVDDEPLGRERIRMLLAEEPDVLVVGECRDGREAVLRGADGNDRRQMEGG